MSGNEFGGGLATRVKTRRTALLESALRKITEAMPLLDQTGHDVAAAHLQNAFDVLSSTYLKTHRTAVATPEQSRDPN